MKIWPRIRSRVKQVDRIYVAKSTLVLGQHKKPEPDSEGVLHFQLFPRFFIEIDGRIGFLFFGEDVTKYIIFSKSGKQFCTATPVAQLIKEAERFDAPELVRSEAIIVLGIIQYINEMCAATIESQAEILSDKRLEVWVPKGDTVRYVRITPEHFRAQAAQAHLDEIIRRRDHPVRGHWRHFKSGQKVWIKAHRRGDPALGTVTSIHELT